MDNRDLSRFRVLVAGYATSSFGSCLNMVALNLFVYEATDSALATGLFMVVRMASGFVAGLLGELYRAALTATEPDLPELTADYVTFTRWEQRYLADPTTVDTIATWASLARRVGAEPLWLPTDRPRQERLTGGGAVVRADLPPSLVAAVTSAATERHTAPYAVLLAVFAALGRELTGSPVTAPHCGIANRTEARFENVIGLFTHSSWLVVPVEGATSFDELVTRATDAVRDRLMLQSVPATVLNEALGGPFAATPPRMLFSLFNDPMPALDLPGVAPSTAVDVDLPVSRAEQTWGLSGTADGGLALRVEYATSLFDADTVTSWTRRYLDLLTRSLHAPDTPEPGGNQVRVRQVRTR